MRRWLVLHLYDDIPHLPNPGDARRKHHQILRMEDRTKWHVPAEMVTDIVEHGEYRSVSTPGNMAQVVETVEELKRLIDG